MTVRSQFSKVIYSAANHFRLFGTSGAFRRALAACGATNEFSAAIPHGSHKVLIRLGTTEVAAFEHVFLNDEYGFSLLHSPRVIIDAGANVGMSAVYFSLRYPAASVFAIEPELSSFEILTKNAKSFPRITPINAALWGQDGFVQLQDGGAGHWGMRVAEAPTSSKHTVRAVTVGTLLREFRIDHIDLMKIDVEGAEREILEAPSLWIDCVDVISAELHDRFRPGCTGAFERATAKFPVRWRRGELHCVARENLISSM